MKELVVVEIRHYYVKIQGYKNIKIMFKEW